MLHVMLKVKIFTLQLEGGGCQKLGGVLIGTSIFEDFYVILW